MVNHDDVWFLALSTRVDLAGGGGWRAVVKLFAHIAEQAARLELFDSKWKVRVFGLTLRIFPSFSLRVLHCNIAILHTKFHIRKSPKLFCGTPECGARLFNYEHIYIEIKLQHRIGFYCMCVDAIRWTHFCRLVSQFASNYRFLELTKGRAGEFGFWNRLPNFYGLEHNSQLLGIENVIEIVYKAFRNLLGHS